MDPVDDPSGSTEIDPRLIGTWDSGMDRYIITATAVSYEMDGYGDMNWTGTIRWVSNFTDDAGVIIVQYQTGKEPTYYDYHGEMNVIPLNGRIFQGIYYDDIKPFISTAISHAIDLATYAPAEKTTLGAAKAAFTMGNKGDYIGFQPIYPYKP